MTSNRSGLAVSAQKPARWRSWLPVALLFMLFAAPMIAAYMWRPAPDAAKTNYGQLVKPARPPIDISLRKLNGEVLQFSALKGKWSLLYVGEKDCNKLCKESLYKIERIRLTQNKNIDRVQSIYIAPSDVGVGTVRERISAYVGVTGMQMSASALIRMAKYFERGDHGPLHRRIYYIDPLGNLMMSYPSDADPTGMRKDLARLLKASQIG